MEIEKYHTDTSRISKSGLDKIAISPLHYHWHYLDPANPRDDKRKKHFEVGDIFHTLTLEPHKFTERFLVMPEKVDRRYKDQNAKWNEWMMKANGRHLLNRDIYNVAVKMRAVVMENPIIKKLLNTGFAERTVLFTEPDTGAPCKCRPDWLTNDEIVLDLKSADDASPRAFERSVRKFRYYVQQPFYSDGIFEELGFYPRHFLFCVVEKDPPYPMAIYKLSDGDVMHGRDVYRRNVETWLECKEKNRWPGYPQTIQEIDAFGM